jgi:hypothetical protein
MEKDAGVVNDKTARRGIIAPPNNKGGMMWRYLFIAAVLLVPSSLMADLPTTALATAASQDAYPLYEKAAKLLQDHCNLHKRWSPSSSNTTFPAYLPFGDGWLNMEKPVFDADADVHDLIHLASAIDRADWPDTSQDTRYLGQCRALANELKDAALYQCIYLKNQPAGFQTLNDSQHMATLLQNQPGLTMVRELVAIGIIGENTWALNIMSSNISITNDPAKLNDLPMSTARQWIARLTDHPSAKDRFDEVMDCEFLMSQKAHSPYKTKSEYLASPKVAPGLPLLLNVQGYTVIERDLAAMSLAAHLFRFQHNRWPANLQELATELPKLPIDPFGDGKQSLGYTLISHGLRGGDDRPLVYSRCNSKDGLFYRTDGPEYGFYRGDGSDADRKLQKQGGEFRDVARWVPSAPKSGGGPTTQSLAP